VWAFVISARRAAGCWLLLPSHVILSELTGVTRPLAATVTHTHKRILSALSDRTPLIRPSSSDDTAGQLRFFCFLLDREDGLTLFRVRPVLWTIDQASQEEHGFCHLISFDFFD
jgi:hypothetical protein